MAAADLKLQSAYMDFEKNFLQRRIGISVLLAIIAWAVLALSEAYFHTKLQSAYISSDLHKDSAFYLLVGERQRGHLVELVGKGYHSAEPNQTQQEVLEKLRKRYPNEFDEKKVVWVLRDEDSAFYYRLKPNWPFACMLIPLLAGLIFFVTGHISKVRQPIAPEGTAR